jgi:hypothetical protein
MLALLFALVFYTMLRNVSTVECSCVLRYKATQCWHCCVLLCSTVQCCAILALCSCALLCSVVQCRTMLACCVLLCSMVQCCAMLALLCAFVPSSAILRNVGTVACCFAKMAVLNLEGSVRNFRNVRGKVITVNK